MKKQESNSSSIKKLVKWKIEIDAKALKELKKLSPEIQQRIDTYILTLTENPRTKGKALQGKYHGCWSYRVGQYRLISSLEDKTLTVLIVKIGHRKDVYD